MSSSFSLQRAFLCSILFLLSCCPLLVASQLEVIGAGLPRTGTLSLRDALNELGYQTYHMMDVIERNKIDDFDYWQQYFQGNITVNEFASEVYEGYNAACDFPTCNAWKDLAKLYPKAKIILTERESPEKWWESVSGTALSDDFFVTLMRKLHPFSKALHETGQHMWTRELGWDEKKSPTTNDKDVMLDFYNRHSKDVKALGKKRVLVYDVSEGWEPLCKFLGKPVPKTPFPNRNSRQEFRARLFLANAVYVCAPIALILCCVLIARHFGFPTEKSKTS